MNWCPFTWYSETFGEYLKCTLLQNHEGDHDCNGMETHERVVGTRP